MKKIERESVYPLSLDGLIYTCPPLLPILVTQSGGKLLIMAPWLSSAPNFNLFIRHPYMLIVK